MRKALVRLEQLQAENTRLSSELAQAQERLAEERIIADEREAEAKAAEALNTPLHARVAALEKQLSEERAKALHEAAALCESMDYDLDSGPGFILDCAAIRIRELLATAPSGDAKGK